jgi:hypothetical protein
MFGCLCDPGFTAGDCSIGVCGRFLAVVLGNGGDCPTGAAGRGVTIVRVCSCLCFASPASGVGDSCVTARGSWKTAALRRGGGWGSWGCVSGGGGGGPGVLRKACRITNRHPPRSRAWMSPAAILPLASHHRTPPLLTPSLALQPLAPRVTTRPPQAKKTGP